MWYKYFDHSATVHHGGRISRVTKTFQYRGLVVEFCTFVQTSGTEKQTSYRRILCRAKNPNFNFLRHVLLWSGPISLVKYFTFVPDELKFGPFSIFWPATTEFLAYNQLRHARNHISVSLNHSAAHLVAENFVPSKSLLFYEFGINLFILLLYISLLFTLMFDHCKHPSWYLLLQIGILHLL